MTRAPELHRHLDVPYVLLMEPVRRPDGEWVRRAAYPELPDCVVEADTPLEAVERLEELRVLRISALLREGRPVPAPRDPLRWMRVAHGAREKGV